MTSAAASLPPVPLSPVPLPDRPFCAAELDDLGISRPWLRRAIRAGTVRSPFRGVFIPADLADSPDLRASAVGLVLSDHHVICDRTAAWIHGIETYALSELTTLPEIETCALRGHAPTRLQGTDGRSRDLAPHDITIIGGVPVTTPLRTALDLGCHPRRREAMAALNGFARRHGVTSTALLGELPRFRRRRGVVQLRALAGLVEGRVESHRESWVWLELHDHGLPAPEPQHWIEIDDVPTYRLDFAWVLAKVCVEYDGVGWHDKTEQQRRRDRDRRQWLRDHGWTVIVVRLGDFTGDALDRWIDELREALRPSYSNGGVGSSGRRVGSKNYRLTDQNYRFNAPELQIQLAQAPVETPSVRPTAWRARSSTWSAVRA